VSGHDEPDTCPVVADPVGGLKSSKKALRVAAYLSAVLALLYAAVSAYWAAGGKGLLSTLGGQLEDLARRGGAASFVLGVTVALIKFAGAALSLALVQPWGRRLPQRLLTAVAIAGGVVLTVYGGLLVVVGALALGGVFGPPPADTTALRWHVSVWDLWFLLWGLLLLVAGLEHGRLRRSTRSR
jgi:hypothetical protein